MLHIHALYWLERVKGFTPFCLPLRENPDISPLNFELLCCPFLKLLLKRCFLSCQKKIRKLSLSVIWKSWEYSKGVASTRPENTVGRQWNFFPCWAFNISLGESTSLLWGSISLTWWILNKYPGIMIPFKPLSLTNGNEHNVSEKYTFLIWVYNIDSKHFGKFIWLRWLKRDTISMTEDQYSDMTKRGWNKLKKEQGANKWRFRI